MKNCGTSGETSGSLWHSCLSFSHPPHTPTPPTLPQLFLHSSTITVALVLKSAAREDCRGAQFRHPEVLSIKSTHSIEKWGMLTALLA